MLPNPILEFGNIKIYMYGVMIALGVLAAFLVLYLYSRKMNIDMSFADFMFYDGIASIFIGFLSAAFFQAVYNKIEDPDSDFDLKGGITFLGGLLGGAALFLIIYFLFRKRLKGRLVGNGDGFPALSVIPCAILIGHALGRVGCFFAGCCYGAQTDSIFGVVFPNKTYLGAVHPTQLYEAVFLLLLFAVCSFLLLKFRFRHNMSVYLIGYGIFRFCIEYLRDDHRGALVGDLSPSQFWSLCMVVLGVALIFILERIWRKDQPAAAAPEESDA